MDNGSRVTGGPMGMTICFASPWTIFLNWFGILIRPEPFLEDLTSGILVSI